MGDDSVVRILGDSIPGLISVYRFGSVARGDCRATSDVDLAFLAEKAVDPVMRFDLQERLAVALHRDVDLVDLKSASTVMRMQIVSTGEVLAVLDRSEHERFETYVYSAYTRLNEERGEILAQVLREGSVHGR